MALGDVDYGLLGVVGGLITFVVYLNGLLAGAMGRFFAIAVGEQKSNRDVGLANGRMWFTTAVMIETILPTLLIVICYPIGDWTIRNFLTIPPERIVSCVWVWRFSCASCYLGMLTLPWNAMYTAHQYIAEVTVYSFVTTTLNVVFLYYMVTHPGVWLTKYAFWQCALNISPSLILTVRAHFIFPECRVVRQYLLCWQNVKKMGAYALWTAWGWLGAILRTQGSAILVNKFFGPKANAGVTVGTTLSNHCDTLSGSMLGAFSPAIYNAWGAKNYDLARNMAYRVCKFGTLLILIFSLPLSLEVDEVLLLWLKNPPKYAAGICLFVMVMTVLDKMSVGHMICVNANGKVAKYQLFVGTSIIMTLPIAWVMIKLGYGVYSIGWAMVITIVFCIAGRVWFARGLVGMSARYWTEKVCLPLLGTIALALIIGSVPRLFMEQTFLRVCVTTTMVELFLLPIAWLFVLDSSERAFLTSKFHDGVTRFKRTVLSQQ